MFTRVKTTVELEAMRESGRMLATILQFLAKHTKPAISTKNLAQLAEVELQKLGGASAFLGYDGFPDVLCVSINEEVVHGVPRTDKIIQDGDIVSLDFGVIYQGMITDAAISLIAGKATNTIHQKLIETTEKSMYAGIDAVHDGVRTGDIGAAVEAVLRPPGYGIVRDLAGHGVGHQLHEDPSIINYGYKGTGAVLKRDMTIAIEPMATLGDHKVDLAKDGRTIITKDGSWAAHFEHTIVITDNGAEILTQL